MAVPRERQPARRMQCAPFQGGRMLRLNLATDGGAVVSGGNLTLVFVVAVIARLALAVAGWLVREVLAASQGTAKMQEIARAVQEGAAAYLRRQFRTLGVFVVLIFFVLLLLPADSGGVRWGRSLFFVIGAVFSALTGFTGMSLTVRGNVRVAAAARESGERRAMRIADRKSTRLNSSHGYISYAVFCLNEEIVACTYVPLSLVH